MRRPPAVARVLERVTATVRDHDMLHPGDLVLVWVSGGPDSVCLLETLVRLRRLLRVRLAVFHFDHRLRAGSAADAGVRAAARSPARPPVPPAGRRRRPRSGESVEAWATVRREDAADDVRRAIGALGPGRGAHARRPSRDRPAEPAARHRARRPCRHLAGQRRSSRLRDRATHARRDPRRGRSLLQGAPSPAPARSDERGPAAASGRDPDTKRSRCSSASPGRDVRATFARTASVLHADRLELLRQAAEHERAIVEHHDGEVRFRAADLATLPRSLAARIVRMALWRMAAVDDVAPWTRDSVASVLDLATGRPGRRRDLPGGRTARRDRVYVRVSSPVDRGEPTMEGEQP